MNQDDQSRDRATWGSWSNGWGDWQIDLSCWDDWQIDRGGCHTDWRGSMERGGQEECASAGDADEVGEEVAVDGLNGCFHVGSDVVVLTALMRAVRELAQKHGNLFPASIDRRFQ